MPTAPHGDSTEAEADLILAGRYRLVARLGSGGFGRVWLAEDSALGVQVAIKEVWVPPGTTAQETAQRVQRAAQEARSAAQLRDNPYIVTVHDVIVERGTPWTVMQYVAGRSLADEILLNGRVGRKTAAKVAASMLAALDACRAAGIVHRDVKPANIMLGDDGSVMLTDFGIAKRQDQTPMTADDVVIGSIEYMAPERARGRQATAASDLFSLGVTLYHAVEGTSPFNRGSGMASLSAILLEELPKPKNAGKLAPLIIALTRKKPEDRPSTAEARSMLEGLDAPSRGSGEAAKEPGAGKAEPKQSSIDSARAEIRTKWSYWPGTVLTLAFVLGLFVPNGITIVHDGVSQNVSMAQLLTTWSGLNTFEKIFLGFAAPGVAIITLAAVESGPKKQAKIRASCTNLLAVVVTFFGTTPYVLVRLWRDVLGNGQWQIFDGLVGGSSTQAQITDVAPGFGLFAYSLSVLLAVALPPLLDYYL